MATTTQIGAPVMTTMPVGGANVIGTVQPDTMSQDDPWAWQDGHCLRSFDDERLRRQMPPELRDVSQVGSNQA